MDGDPQTDSSNDFIDLRGDGRVVLYKRPGLKKPKWQVRVRVPKATGYRIVSSKTSNWDEAKRFADELYEQTYMHILNGGQMRSRTFRQVFEEWEKNLDSLGPNRQGGTHNPSVDRVRIYALPYFGSTKIEKIGPKEFEAFWIWRKSNFSKKQPSNGTLGREKNALAPLFKYAVSKGYIPSVPAMSVPKAKHTRRSTFTLDEYNHLIRQMRRWVKESVGKAHWRDRYVFQQCFIFLANTGLRIGELRRLSWGDLGTLETKKGQMATGTATGKTGTRDFILMNYAPIAAKRLRKLREQELGHEPPAEGYVFCHRNGKEILSFKRSFKSILKYAKIPEEREGMARTIYSLRHFFATQRLSHDTNPFALAKIMGTSVEMIEKFYGHVVTAELAEQLTKGTRIIK